MIKNVVCISYVLIISLSGVGANDIFADSVKVYGTVTDSESGAALSDAQIMFVSSIGDTTRTVTETGGEYEVFLDVQTVSVDNSNLPSAISLGQNFPNPFNPSTTIEYSLEQAGYVQLAVYNIMGQTVRQLVKGYTHAGNHRVVWDGTSQDGSSVAAGIYFYQLRTGDVSVVRKMLLLDGGGSFTALHHLTEQISVAKTLANTAAETEYILAVKCDGYVTYEDYDFAVSTDTRVDIALEEKHGATFYGTIIYTSSSEWIEDESNGSITPLNIIVYDTLDYTEKLADITIEYPDPTFEITGLPGSVVDVVIQGDYFFSVKKSEIDLKEDDDTTENISFTCKRYNIYSGVIGGIESSTFMTELKSAYDDSTTATFIIDEYDCTLKRITIISAYQKYYVYGIPENNLHNPAQMIQLLNNDYRTKNSFPNFVFISD